jgi:hypothetical protein
MPTPIGQVFNELALKAGIAADNPALKSLLASPELAAIQVPDELITGIDNGLLSLDAAKNNHPAIKSVYTAAAYDGMDKHLITLLGSDTFDQADLDEIKAEKSTSKKYELTIAKLKAAKATAKGADKEEINRQLAAAHEAAKLAKDEVNNVRNEYEGKIKDIQLKAAIKAVFGNYKTIYDELPPAVRTATMEALINQALQDKNAEFRTDEQGNLQLVSKDGSNVFGENHVQLTPPSFLDKTFAPILKVSGPIKPAAQQRQQNTVIPGKVEADAEANVSQISSHNQSVIDQLSKPSAVLI